MKKLKLKSQLNILCSNDRAEADVNNYLQSSTKLYT
jgi:hypothetical protein